MIYRHPLAICHTNNAPLNSTEAADIHNAPPAEWAMTAPSH